MVNEPGKLTATKRAPQKEKGAGQFAIPKGEEEENYDQLLGQYAERKVAEGEAMEGTDYNQTQTDVVVDIRYNSQAVTPVTQFTDATGHLTINAGHVIDDLLEDTNAGGRHA